MGPLGSPFPGEQAQMTRPVSPVQIDRIVIPSITGTPGWQSTSLLRPHPCLSDSRSKPAHSLSCFLAFP